MPDWKAAATLVRKIAENYRLPYYTLSPVYSVCSEHGYLIGEHFKCPICGKPAEVYSRITGYYRPVQNWNEGKTQEYKDRKAYDIANSTLTHVGPQAEGTPVCKPQEEKGSSFDKPILFARKDCPKCQTAKILLQKAGVDFTVVDAEENAEGTM